MTKPVKKWPIGIIIIATLMIAGIFGFLNRSRSRISSENAGISSDIRSNLHVGDSEEILKSFLLKKGWDSSFDPILGGYTHELKVGSGFLDEHFVVIHFAIIDHKIMGIEVEDFHRSL